MPESDRNSYKKHLDIYFQKKAIHLAYQYNMEEEFKQAYAILQSMGEITKTERQYDYYMHHHLARYWSEKKPKIKYWLHKLHIS